MKTRRRSTLLFTMLAMLVSLSWNTALAQGKSKQKNAQPTGKPVLMRDSVDPASLDLYLGPGGEEMKPDLSSLTFIKEEAGGYSTKYRVRDAAGRIWIAKVSKEAQSETAATRIVWAAGYHTDISYLVPRIEIKGKGTFENVRLEARPTDVKRLDEWQWESNPFSGTRELQGLKVLMVLLNNWDIKNANNRIIAVKNDQTGETELRYIVSDLGATLGKAGNFFTRSRNKPEDFVEARFIEKVDGGKLRFKYDGKNQSMLEDITVDHARWIGERLSRFTDEQLAGAFRAGNYSPDEISALTQTLRGRISQLIDVNETAVK